MDPISDIRLKWYDDSTLLEDDPRRLTELFLDCLGIRSDVATDIFESLLMGRAKGHSLTTSEIREDVIKRRKERKYDNPDEVNIRSIQIWLKHFRKLKLLGRIKSRYMFTNNRLPSEIFAEHTKGLIDGSVAYMIRGLEKIETVYDIKD